MNRIVRIALGLLLSMVPAASCLGQQMVVSPAPKPGCVAPPSVDSTVYDLGEVAPGPQLRTAPGPQYPAALRRARINGYATLAYVINADGIVDSTTVTVMAVTDSAFIAPSRVTVLGARFWPACRAGVPVRVQVTQTLRFETAN